MHSSNHMAACETKIQQCNIIPYPISRNPYPHISIFSQCSSMKTKQQSCGPNIAKEFWPSFLCT